MNIFEKCENTKHQGNLGVADAITKLTQKGYPVLIPFGEAKDYDLAFDDGSLRKVQVRTTTTKNRNRLRDFTVHLRVMGGNRSFHTAKLFDNQKIDYLFVLTGENESYLIPSSEIKAKTYLTLNESMNKYRIWRKFIP